MVSNKLEKGTTFRCKLPVIRSKAANSEQSLKTFQALHQKN